MSIYELTFLLSSEEELKNIKDLLKSMSIEVVKEQTWGKRQLAYSINKLKSASYYNWTIQLENKDVKELRKKLNFSGKVMRYLLLAGK